MKEKKETIKINRDQEAFLVDTIKGDLKCIIIDSVDKVSITIMSELGYSILYVPEHQGVKYYSPRSTLRGPEERLEVKDQFDKFCLNEELEIIINGPINSEVTFMFRYD